MQAFQIEIGTESGFRDNPLRTESLAFGDSMELEIPHSCLDLPNLGESGAEVAIIVDPPPFFLAKCRGNGSLVNWYAALKI